MKKDFKSPMKKISHQQIDEQLKNQDITNPEPFHIHPSYNVVGAAIMKDNKVLIAQRRDGELKGKWEFPGGKIEEGETPQQALQREIKEELDIDVSVLNRIDSSYWEYTDRNINLSVYECAYVSWIIRDEEHLAVKWIDVQNILNEDLADADKPIAKTLLQNLANDHHG